MTITVNPVEVTVDEDLITLNDPDEVLAVTYSAALQTIVAGITKAAPTTDFTTAQLAVQPSFFTIGANTTDLKFVASGGSPPAEYSDLAGEGVLSGLQTTDGQDIYLFRADANSNVIYGAIGNDPANDAAFVAVLDETFSGSFVTGAKLWLLQFATLLHDGQNVTEGDLLDLTDKVFVASTSFVQSVFSDFSDVPAGSPIFAMIADDTNQNPVDYLVTAFQDGAKGTGIQLNVSNQGSFPGSLASGSQNISYGTALRFDLVTDGDNTYTQSEGQTDTAIEFNTHQNVVQAGFTIVQNQGNRPTDLKIELWDSLSDTADGHNFFTSVLNEASVAIDKITVGLIDPDTNVVTPLFDSSNPADASHFVFSGNAITVKGLHENYIVDIYQDSGFDRFTALNVTTTTFKGNIVPDTNAFVDIGRLTFTQQDQVADVDEVGSHMQFDDSGPTIATTGTVPTFTVDESGLATGTDSGNPGQTDDTHSVAANFVSAYGSDGPGTLTYALKVVDGTDSGLDDVATGENILLRLNAGVVEGYTAVTNLIAFTVSISGANVTLTDLRAIKHDPGGVDEAKTMAADLIKVEATITDAEGGTTGDTATAEVSISDKFNFEDDEPTITVTPSPGGSAGTPLVVTNAAGEDATGAFGFDIGADKPGAYGGGVSDFVDANGALAGVQLSLSGTVSGPPSSAITNTNVTLFSESATAAVFNFSFDYDQDPNAAGVQTGTATGTLSFDKDDETYTVALTSPVQGFSISVLHSSDLLQKVPTGNTGHPEIVVTELDVDSAGAPPDGFYVQFTANSNPQSNVFGFNATGDGAPVAGDTAFNNGQFVTSNFEDWVSATQSTNGVAGDTIQKGELLTLRFFGENILSDAADNDPNTSGVQTIEKVDPTTVAAGIAIKFDGIGNSEDLVVILDLKDADGNETTRAINVQNSDLIKGAVPSPYNTEFTLDNNDALLVIESNDYNAAGETYQIQGIQIMQSANGLTGNAINLNGAVGSGGGSNATSGLTAWDPLDNDVLKIVDIGFIQQVPVSQDAHLDFSLQIRDADVDLTTTQHLFVDFLSA